MDSRDLDDSKFFSGPRVGVLGFESDEVSVLAPC